MIKQSIFFITALFISSLCFTGCSDDDDDYLGNWVEMGDFSGKVRSHAVTFTIGDKVYVGTGYDYYGNEKFKDFWELTIDNTNDVPSFNWTQVQELPGVARNRAVAFASNSKGYVGLGSDKDDNRLKDFWAFTPGTGWTEVTAEFPGSARRDAVAFYVNNKGYVGTGEDDDNGNLNDFYSYDPSTNTWNTISSIKSKRRGAATFVLNDEAYLISGLDNGTAYDDFFRYDATNNKWVELNKISNFTDSSFDDDYDNKIQRYDAAAFTMGGKAYITTGTGNNYTWEWDPMTDRWKQKTDFEGSSRSGALAFSLNDIGYVITGGNGTYSFDDMWYFEPYEEYENKD